MDTLEPSAGEKRKQCGNRVQCLGFSCICNITAPTPADPPGIWYPLTSIMPKLPAPDIHKICILPLNIELWLFPPSLALPAIILQDRDSSLSQQFLNPAVLQNPWGCLLNSWATCPVFLTQAVWAWESAFWPAGSISHPGWSWLGEETTLWTTLCCSWGVGEGGGAVLVSAPPSSRPGLQIGQSNTLCFSFLL